MEIIHRGRDAPQSPHSVIRSDERCSGLTPLSAGGTLPALRSGTQPTSTHAHRNHVVLAGLTFLAVSASAAPRERKAVEEPLPAPSVPPSGYGTTGAPLATEWPLGQIVTGIPCRGNERLAFHLYLPRGLQSGRRYPLLLLATSAKPAPSALGRFLDAAELNGWMIVLPTVGGSENFDEALAAARCVLSNALARLPVDPKRVYGGGLSHGVLPTALAVIEARGIEPAGLLLINTGVGPEEIAALPKTAAIATIGSAAHTSR